MTSTPHEDNASPLHSQAAARPQAPVEQSGQTSAPRTSWWTVLALVVALSSAGGSLVLWRKVQHAQEQLAQQSALATHQATQAQALAGDARTLMHDAATRLGVVESRLNEVSVQREQLEALVQNLSRTRDDTLALDIEAAVRLALQQLQLTGNTAPLAATLQTANQRITRTAQPRLAAVQRAIQRDLERLSSMQVADTASLLARLDELVLATDDLPLANGPATLPLPDTALPPVPPTASQTTADAGAATATDAVAFPHWAWWQERARHIWAGTLHEIRHLARITRIDHPEALLLSPQQGLFLRENIKLQLLNARLALLSQQYGAARTGLQSAHSAIGKYFAPQSARTRKALDNLAHMQQHLQSVQTPTLEDTLSALAAATAQPIAAPASHQ